MARMRAPTIARASESKHGIIPARCAISGMTLYEAPAWKRVIDSTIAFNVSVLREMIDRLQPLGERHADQDSVDAAIRPGGMAATTVNGDVKDGVAK